MRPANRPDLNTFGAFRLGESTDDVMERPISEEAERVEVSSEGNGRAGARTFENVGGHDQKEWGR